MKVIAEDVDPQDICQGELGDCYFLAVISACAEEPRRVLERFITKSVNSAAVYLVTLYVNGVVTPIIVDDWLPSVYNKAAFCSSKCDEIWGCILEKAWAKLHGSYGRTAGG